MPANIAVKNKGKETYVLITGLGVRLCKEDGTPYEAQLTRTKAREVRDILAADVKSGKCVLDGHRVVYASTEVPEDAPPVDPRIKRTVKRKGSKDA